MKTYFRFVAVAICTTTILFRSPTVAVQAQNDLEDIASQSTVLIRRQTVIGPRKFIPQGSGTIIGWKESLESKYYIYYIVTANHVVSGSNNRYEVETYDGEKYQVELNAVREIPGERCVDLAVLWFSSNKTYAPVKLEQNYNLLSKNTEVYVFGWADGIDPILVRGTIENPNMEKRIQGGSCKKEYCKCKEWLGISTLSLNVRPYEPTPKPGMSGGPVLNNNGNLLGIYTGEDLFSNFFATSIKTFEEQTFKKSTLRSILTQINVEPPIIIEPTVSANPEPPKKKDLTALVKDNIVIIAIAGVVILGLFLLGRKR